MKRKKEERIDSSVFFWTTFSLSLSHISNLYVSLYEDEGKKFEYVRKIRFVYSKDRLVVDR